MTKPFPDISEIFIYEYLGNKPEKGGHQIKIKHEELKAILEFFYRDSRFWCDYLISISGQHKTGTPEQIGLHYHLKSITTGIEIHIESWKEIQSHERCSFESVVDLWKTANWHERETSELYGIDFIGHPDQRNLLLPSNWKGFPLRKNYVEQEVFHGIKVKF